MVASLCREQEEKGLVLLLSSLSMLLLLSNVVRGPAQRLSGAWMEEVLASSGATVAAGRSVGFVMGDTSGDRITGRFWDAAVGSYSSVGSGKKDGGGAGAAEEPLVVCWSCGWWSRRSGQALSVL